MRGVDIQCTQTQRQFLEAVLAEDSEYSVIGFGGARGGGKTFVSAMAALLTCLAYPRVTVLLLRKGEAAVVNNYREEIRAIAETLGVAKSFRYLVQQKIFRCANGSELHLGHASTEADYEKYMGIEYARIGFEEATQHESLVWDRIGGSLRTKNADCRPVRWITCNPGGLGHQWVKERFVDPKTRYKGHLWIPSRIGDCPFTLQKNPNYVKEVLDTLPPWQRRQWKDGDWDAISGAYFTLDPAQLKKSATYDQFSQVTEDEENVYIPPWAEWYAGVDYGDAKPFAVVYMARWKEYYLQNGDIISRDRAHFVSCLYKANLDLDEQAYAVQEYEQLLRDKGWLQNDVIYYADPSVSARVETVSTATGRTKARIWAEYGFYVRAAHTNNREAGWKLWKLLLRRRILTTDPDECRPLLSEMQSAQVEGAPGPPKSEDIQQGNSIADHALDAGRYCLVSTFGIGYRADEMDELGARKLSAAPKPRIVT